MIAVVIATLLGRKLLGATIYERKLLRRGIDWQRIRSPRVFARVSVSEVGRTPPCGRAAGADHPVARAEKAGHSELAFPVCDGERFAGVIDLADVSAP